MIRAACYGIAAAACEASASTASLKERVIKIDCVVWLHRDGSLTLLLRCLDMKDTFSVSLLTSLTAPNGWAITAPRPGSNDAFSILGDIAALIVGGHIQDGDGLVHILMLCRVLLSLC